MCNRGWEHFDGECFKFLSGSDINYTCKAVTVHTKDQQMYIHHRLLVLGWTLTDVAPICKSSKS